MTPDVTRDVDDEERGDPIERELRVRAEERAQSHWVTWRCTFGHTFEAHRTSVAVNYREEGATMRCVICGRDAHYESPEQTVRRAWDADHTPLAIARQWADAMADWAQQQLNARTWTDRSDARRRQQQRQRQQHDDQTRDVTRGARTDLFPPSF